MSMFAAPRALAWLACSLVACTRPSAVIDLPREADGAPAKAEPTPTAGGTIPSTDVLACPIRVDDEGNVLIAEQPTGVSVDPDMAPRVRGFPWDHEQILVAIGMTSPAYWAEPEQIGTLFRVDCEAPRDWVSLVHIEGADFAWAELSLDRRWLYFSHPGVGVFDFAAWDWARLAPSRTIDQCWSSETPIEAEDYVFGRIADDALVVYSGGPCGFEAEWEGRTQVIDGIREDELPFRRDRAYVGTVAADGAGRLWVGDGGQCSVAESVYSPGHPGLWRSDDAGESWTFVPIAGLQGRGIASLWIHASDGARMLAQAECCYGFAADFCEGGELLLSEDGGASWTEVSPRLAQPDPDLVGPVDQLEVDRAAWQIEVHVASYASELRLVSRDGGRSWQELAADQSITPIAIPREADVGDWHFAAELEGLSRIDVRRPMDPGRIVLRPVR
ncbi:WD40/YVTN/BNR-like repeat-containing protein [Nannocystaceae bacterium ST9]